MFGDSVGEMDRPCSPANKFSQRIADNGQSPKTPEKPFTSGRRRSIPTEKVPQACFSGASSDRSALHGDGHMYMDWKRYCYPRTNGCVPTEVVVLNCHGAVAGVTIVCMSDADATREVNEESIDTLLKAKNTRCDC